MKKIISIILLLFMLVENILCLTILNNKKENVSPLNFKGFPIRLYFKQQEMKVKNLGEFKLTAYCNCEKCCGKWAGGPTASGKMPKANHTIAVDPDIIPLGTQVLINGIIYTAEDTGSAIKGKRIDIYCDTHEECYDDKYNGYANVYEVQIYE